MNDLHFKYKNEILHLKNLNDTHDLQLNDLKVINEFNHKKIIELNEINNNNDFTINELIEKNTSTELLINDLNKEIERLNNLDETKLETMTLSEIGINHITDIKFLQLFRLKASLQQKYTLINQFSKYLIR